jgi:outer membrane protein TolC
MRESRGVVVAAVMLSWGLASGVSAEVVQLKDLEQRALEHHALLSAGAARERAAAATVREAESAYMPRVGFNLDSNVAPGRRIVKVPTQGAAVRQNADGTLTVDPNTNDYALVQGVNALKKSGNGQALLPQWRSTAMLMVGANLYDFGRTAAAVAAARAQHESRRVEQDVTRAQVLGGVRVAYLTWLSAHELHRLSATATEDGTRRSRRVLALVQEGARPRAEIAPVEADRLLSELERERAEGDLDSSRLMVEQAVGLPLSTTAEPDLSVLDVQPPSNGPQRQVDPSLRMLVHQRAALEATARMHRKEGSPVLSASGGAGVGLQISGDTPRVLPSYAVGLAMAIPLWDGGGNKAAADATEAQADELRLRLESTESEREHERKRARLDAEHAEKRQHTAEQLLEVCSSRVTDVEAGYELGAMQFDQVQQARAQLRRAQTEVVLARVARAEAVLRFAP